MLVRGWKRRRMMEDGWRNEQEVLKRKIEKKEKRRGGCRSVESSEIERKRGGEKEKK